MGQHIVRQGKQKLNDEAYNRHTRPQVNTIALPSSSMKRIPACHPH